MKNKILTLKFFFSILVKQFNELFFPSLRAFNDGKSLPETISVLVIVNFLLYSGKIFSSVFNMTADIDCVPLDLSLNKKFKVEVDHDADKYTSEDDSSEYNSDHNPDEGKDKQKAYKKNLMKRYRE